MARSGPTHLQDIDEKFCQCPICLRQYKEPKQLPCLHRYCSDCLKQLIERDQGVAKATCPECREKFPIPENGVDGFKTDFYMKNIIEYVQLQKSLEPKQLQECFDCSKEVKVISYCFKCNGFLCKDCHDHHMTKRTLKDHKQHTLFLKDLKSKHMTLDMLTDLKEAPRCESHPQDLCKLCCRTCNDSIICVTCTYGIHKNHDIIDIGIIAAGEREKLKDELKDLSKHEVRLLKMPETVQSINEKLIFNVRKKKQNFRTRYERNITMVKKHIEKTEEDHQLRQTEIENNKERDLIETRKQMEEEMKLVKIKYDRIFDEIKQQSRDHLDNLKHSQEEELLKSREKFAILGEDFQTFNKAVETSQEKGLKAFHEISEKAKEVIEQYKHLTSTGYSILETKNDWTAVQCIPDICKAIGPLGEDIKRDFTQLDTLSRMWIIPEIIEDEQSPVIVEGIKEKDWTITGIAGDDDGGNIVITGYKSGDCTSHITVIDTRGELLHQKVFTNTWVWPYRYCAYLSEFKVATTCTPNEVGFFDIRDYSYIKKNISKVISSGPVGRYVNCVATDPVNNYILVGRYNSRDVYVIDDKLNNLQTLTLPETITYPFDMTISEGNILVCDREGKAAYVVSMEGQEGKVTHEFTQPDFDQNYGRPLSVCTDSNGFIYILWMSGSDLTAGRRVVVQYTQDGLQSLTAIPIDSKDATCIATVKSDKKENLLVASWKCGKLYFYSLT